MYFRQFLASIYPIQNLSLFINGFISALHAPNRIQSKPTTNLMRIKKAKMRVVHLRANLTLQKLCVAIVSAQYVEEKVVENRRMPLEANWEKTNAAWMKLRVREKLVDLLAEKPHARFLNLLPAVEGQPVDLHAVLAKVQILLCAALLIETSFRNNIDD